jgi:hypothetical protein
VWKAPPLPSHHPGIPSPVSLVIPCVRNQDQSLQQIHGRQGGNCGSLVRYAGAPTWLHTQTCTHTHKRTDMHAHPQTHTSIRRYTDTLQQTRSCKQDANTHRYTLRAHTQSHRYTCAHTHLVVHRLQLTLTKPTHRAMLTNTQKDTHSE